MKIDGETGGQVLVTVAIVLIVVAVVFRWKWLRGKVTGLSAAVA